MYTGFKRCSRRRAGEAATSAGFTLIEMLVTLTLYGLVMSVLLVGLQSGIRGWRTLARHQTQTAELAKTFDRLRSDLRHLCAASEDLPPLVETDSDATTDALSLTVLEPRLRQRAGKGVVWYRVEYSVREPREGASPALIRRAVPCVTATPNEAAATEEVLLSSVRRFNVSYATVEGTRNAWEDAKKLPLTVTVNIGLEGGRSALLSTAVPCAMQGGNAP